MYLIITVLLLLITAAGLLSKQKGLERLFCSLRYPQGAAASTGGFLELSGEAALSLPLVLLPLFHRWLSYETSWDLPEAAAHEPEVAQSVEEEDRDVQDALMQLTPVFHAPCRSLRSRSPAHTSDCGSVGDARGRSRHGGLAPIRPTREGGYGRCTGCTLVHTTNGFHTTDTSGWALTYFKFCRDHHVTKIAMKTPMRMQKTLEAPDENSSIYLEKLSLKTVEHLKVPLYLPTHPPTTGTHLQSSAGPAQLPLRRSAATCQMKEPFERELAS
ncbi:uncharacterized protein LOC129348963 [Amphiprion ocellaris]|uniref:uncharacterized protein LOC129348963 n=1 Tax=Amphiprion ocellaris TaxID=80972 RepID=UPI002410D3A6|nr:uncharacterized protein LOC129348963 [Amphiprion ocellaris]